MKANLKTFLSSYKAICIFVIISMCVMGVFMYISDYPTFRGNYGPWKYALELTIQISISLGIGLYCSLNYIRHHYFKIKTGKARNLLTTAGGISSALVIGCPACGFTLAGLFGLATIISLLPYGWHELKYIWLIMIIVANILLLRDLKTCPVRKR